MPNHIKNLLSVIGKPADVSAFVAAARGAIPQPGQPYPPHNPVMEPLCFQALVPLPDDYFVRDYSSYGHDAEVKIWGVKWGAYSPHVPEAEQGIATYRFETAWCPPTVFLGKVAVKYPQLEFLLSYGGEGSIRGFARFSRGNQDGSIFRENSDQIKKDISPNLDPEKDEEAYWDAFTAAREKYLASHPLRAAMRLAAFNGVLLQEGEEGILVDWLQENGCELLCDAVAGRRTLAGVKLTA